MNLTNHHAEYLTRELIRRTAAGTVEGVVNVLANARVGLNTRLQRIKEISGELTTIGNSQQKAAEYSASLYQDLSNDVKTFQEKLEQFQAPDVVSQQ